MTVTVTSTAGLAESGRPPREPFPLADLAATFDLGHWRSVRWLRGGKNEHAEVVTDRATYFLRRSYRSKALASLNWQVELLMRLRGQDLPVPEPMPCRNGGHVAEFGDRLYFVTRTLPGTPYDPEQPEHLRAMGRQLAGYHALVPTLGVVDPEPEQATLRDSVLDRLRTVDALAFPELLHVGRRVAARLDRLWPQLPTTVLHGGCRRGSLLFTGSTITGLLDFDSARFGPRALDVATAVHDVSKVYTESGRPDHKVVLDLDRIRIFLAAYRESGDLSAAEAEAIPVLIAAKRIKRALGRAARMAGASHTDDDTDKIRLEFARLTWLDDHATELSHICAA